ncbi:MAG TPA: hypothetical protein PK339_09520 [Flavitalea sp.]|nr:hypothetical protein [Flavitalea sp.]
MTMNNQLHFFMTRIPIFLLMIVTTLCCTKTKYEKLKRPYDAIEHFSIAGYGDLDSIDAVISGNEIKLYWSAEAERPATIKPSIAVSPGASISPASGEAVAFSETTAYTVTAEDGTKKEYKLKPIVNEAIPILAAFDNPIAWQWATSDQLKINGEYFLNGGGVGNVKAFARRLRDGYEFDLPIDQEKTIQTQLIVDLPKFTADLDTGLHRIYLKVGDFPSNSLEVYIGQPVLSNVATSLTLKEAGQTIYLDDTLTLTFNLGPKIDLDQFKKYFSKDNIGVENSVQFNFGYNTEPEGTHYSAVHYDSSGVILEDNQLKIPFGLGNGRPEYALPNFEGGTYINEILIQFNYDYSYYGANYAKATDFTAIYIISGTTTTGGPLGSSYRDFTKYADEDTRKRTILAMR